MIRGIVAIDEQRGMANDQGIPWDLPGDAKQYVEHLQTGDVLMGYGTYLEVEQPWGDHDNYVATRTRTKLRPGFEAVADARQWLHTRTGDVWNVGGPGLLAMTLDQLDELYITQIEADFHCTKFLPEFHQAFHLVSQSEPQRESGVTYRFEVWQRNKEGVT